MGKPKNKKIKEKIRVCDFHDQFVPDRSNLYAFFVAENTMPRETKSHKTEINSYLIEAMRFHDRRAL